MHYNKQLVEVGSGSNVFFWSDAWLLDAPLRVVYPNLFRLEKSKWVKVADRIVFRDGVKSLAWNWRHNPHSYEEITELFQLLNDIHDFTWKGGEDSWKWKPEPNGLFSVSSAKKVLATSSPNSSSVIKWKVWVPLKCKILVWRAARNRLPTVAELLIRGINIQQTSCSLCNVDLETSIHLFTGCVYSQQVWARVEAWCRHPPGFAFDVKDLILLSETQNLPKEKEIKLRGIIYTTFWMLWGERNNRIFNSKQRSPQVLVELIKSTTYFWIRNRSRWKSIDWNNWYNYPLY
ncbi:hypothetical protein SSX86_015215 [Deinandra increscens subsp. villosa]|uniref:Reverse transcriptase zinc-binding domain-containing protein n=1 Tax=Deinandra increscens subsp. villosa TaxID=3103831 RepID=A0AAP0D6Y1_9ASTR